MAGSGVLKFCSKGSRPSGLVHCKLTIEYMNEIEGVSLIMKMGFWVARFGFDIIQSNGNFLSAKVRDAGRTERGWILPPVSLERGMKGMLNDILSLLV